MRLLYISTFLFAEIEGRPFGLPANSGPFFEKYLDVFDEVRVLGDPLKSFLDISALVPLNDRRISVRIIPPNTHPRDFINDRVVKQILKEEILKAEAILIKPSTRKGMMAEKIAKKFRKPFMIEMTGDIHNALLHQRNLIKRIYAPIIYHQIRKNMNDCKFGLYVSKDYLQRKYPIKGEQCGCSDVILESATPEILDHRFQMIDDLYIKNRVDIALIGFYQGLMKGVDTAIRALSQLPPFFHLNILGNGTEENRQKWVAYGEKLGVYGRIHFPQPLPSSHDVLKWLDSQDFFVLPSLSEGLCRCVVEAISRGCICFCSDITTMPELLPPECLFQPGDDNTLASKLSYAYQNPDTMKTLARRNFVHAKNYDYMVLRERRNQFLQRFRSFCESGAY